MKGVGCNVRKKADGGGQEEPLNGLGLANACVKYDPKSSDFLEWNFF